MFFYARATSHKHWRLILRDSGGSDTTNTFHQLDIWPDLRGFNLKPAFYYYYYLFVYLQREKENLFIFTFTWCWTCLWNCKRRRNGACFFFFIQHEQTSVAADPDRDLLPFFFTRQSRNVFQTLLEMIFISGEQHKQSLGWTREGRYLTESV